MTSKFLGIFLIISLITVGAFALLSIGVHEHTNSYSCPISTINGGVGCMIDIHEDLLTSAFYHISGMHSFTNGIGGASVNISLLIIFLFTIILILRIFTLNFDISFLTLFYQRRQKTHEYLAIYWKPFLRWIVFRNKTIA